MNFFLNFPDNPERYCNQFKLDEKRALVGDGHSSYAHQQKPLYHTYRYINRKFHFGEKGCRNKKYGSELNSDSIFDEQLGSRKIFRVKKSRATFF